MGLSVPGLEVALAHACLTAVTGGIPDAIVAFLPVGVRDREAAESSVTGRSGALGRRAALKRGAGQTPADRGTDLPAIAEIAVIAAEGCEALGRPADASTAHVEGAAERPVGRDHVATARCAAGVDGAGVRVVACGEIAGNRCDLDHIR